MSEDFVWAKGKVAEEVYQIVSDELKDKRFEERKTPKWINSILEKTMAKLDTLGADKAFKFSATCTIIQRTGHGIHTASASYWDKNNDETISIQYPKKIRAPGSIAAFVTIFAYSMHVDQEEEL
mmetsp:Transcript_10736/g.12746  ORF Transcript_10736/g.12746 Transcript_10736/m.12746 type:complete len:124 (-) Transcript_10736:402-773(-)|eukprot:jgi/Bigna1/73646/fgenesh1_pg.25_\